MRPGARAMGGPYLIAELLAPVSVVGGICRAASRAAWVTVPFAPCHRVLQASVLRYLHSADFLALRSPLPVPIACTGARPTKCSMPGCATRGRIVPSQTTRLQDG